ncbi:G2/M phase-specific E3 ubiquitin-protein ligase-like isoform X2 [Betta splendens]|uniref:HECT-type E3 ubiquitin transferase n=1 Tax=Betta splendens TaxID=158456 RepID=A0A6P7N844_BETSP|nr:G2/M phase-specific E3 ubiquitin-protein ligase-like isoform X2 [Betta splendens]
MAVSSGSLPLSEIERAVTAGVRAALQAAVPQALNTPLTVSTLPGDTHRHPGTATASLATAVTSLRSVPLPSIPGRHVYRSRHINRRHVKTYTKEVVCLPFSLESSLFVIPRGDSRSRLAEAGLIGKMSFSTEWTEDQLRWEITAIFRRVFGLSEHQLLPFQFLSTIKGCKKLMKPQVTSNFPWGGKEVASMCSNFCMYIMAEMEAPSQNLLVELSDDSDFESQAPQLRRSRRTNVSSISQREQYERQEGEETRPQADIEMELHEQRGPNQATTHFTDFIPVYVDDEEAIEEAIRRSLSEEAGSSSLQDSRFARTLSKEEITGIVKAHSERVVTTSYKPIYISRGNLWTTALRQFSRQRFAESTHMLYVTFASDEDITEDAEDLGGPRREFFRLLVKAIYKESGAFEESSNGFIPRLNITHVQNGLYRTIGQMMATIIVQGGESPALLSPLVVGYLLTGHFQFNVTPDDVADMELREALKKVDQAASKDELDQAIGYCESWQYQIEGLPNPVTMDNKDAFVKSAILFHVLIQRQSCYDQLGEGLKQYEVFSLLKENPGIRVLLEMPQKCNDVTDDDVATLLKPVYSVLGSNKRPREELLVVKFREFLHCVQEKEIGERLHARDLTEAEKEFIQTLTAGHILAFATGSSQVPATGFLPSPKLTFVHDETKHLPVSHTCSNELQMFVNKKNLEDDDEFDYHFLVALMNGAIFSAV